MKTTVNYDGLQDRRAAIALIESQKFRITSETFTRLPESLRETAADASMRPGPAGTFEVTDEADGIVGAPPNPHYPVIKAYLVRDPATWTAAEFRDVVYRLGKLVMRLA